MNKNLSLEKADGRKRQKPLLQLALDFLAMDEALQMAALVHPHFDWVEIGTPLVLNEGLRALEVFRRRFPDKKYLADLKIMDAGNFEAGAAFRRGADIVTVLAAADDRTIMGVLQAAEKYNGLVMADLINAPNPRRRARELEKLGVNILCLHTAHDAQGGGKDPLRELKIVRPLVKCRLAVAGGLDSVNAPEAVALGADIVIVGGGITRAPDPKRAASLIHNAIRNVSA